MRIYRVNARGLVILCLVGLCGLAVVWGCNGRKNSHLRAGIEKLREGDFATAVTLLELAAESQPDNPSVHCNLGLAYWKLGQTSRAIQAFKNADRLSRSDERPLEFLGQIYFAEGDMAEAGRAFEMAAERAPLSARILTSQAVVAHYAGDVQRARTLLESALELNPAYAPAIYNMAVLYRGPLNDPTMADDYFSQYIRIGPEGERKQTVRKWLGVVPDTQASAVPPDVAPSAVAPSSRMVSVPRAPDDTSRPVPSPAPREDRAGAVIARAKRAISEKELDTALILLNRCVVQVPESADALWLLAVLYEKHLGYEEQARATYQQFKQQFPDDPRTQTIPVSVSRQERVAPAPKPEPKPEPQSPPVGTPEPDAPQRNQDAARHALRQGVRSYQAREWEAAIAAYKQALSLDPTMTDAFYNLGLAYKASGNPRQARESLSQAIEMNPNMLSARYMLAVVCRDLDDLDAALEQLDVVLENDPHYAKAHLLLGLVYRDLGRNEEARRHIQRYMNMEPDSRFTDELKAWIESKTESP